MRKGKLLSIGCPEIDDYMRVEGRGLVGGCQLVILVFTSLERFGLGMLDASRVGREGSRASRKQCWACYTCTVQWLIMPDLTVGHRQLVSDSIAYEWWMTVRVSAVDLQRPIGGRPRAGSRVVSDLTTCP